MRKLSFILISAIVCTQAIAGEGVPGLDPALQQVQQQNTEAGHSSMGRTLDQYNIRLRHARPKPEQTTTQATQAETPAQPAQIAAPVENCFTNPKMPGCMTKEEINSLTSPSTPSSEQ